MLCLIWILVFRVCKFLIWRLIGLVLMVYLLGSGMWVIFSLVKIGFIVKKLVCNCLINL